jgi:hypothetical protein
MIGNVSATHAGRYENPPATLRVAMRAGLGAPETLPSLLVSRAGLDFRPTRRPGRNNALGQAHSPAIELRLKTTRLA